MGDIKEDTRSLDYSSHEYAANHPCSMMGPSIGCSYLSSFCGSDIWPFCGLVGQEEIVCMLGFKISRRCHGGSSQSWPFVFRVKSQTP